MRVHVNDPALVEPLLDYLRERIACVAARVSDNEVEVSLLESFGLEAHRVELDRMVEAWAAAHAAGRATIRRDAATAPPAR